MTKSKTLTLDEAQAAHEADPKDPNASGAYLLRLMAAAAAREAPLSDIIERGEKLRAALAEAIGGRFPAIAEKLCDLCPDAPPQVIVDLAKKLEAAGQEPVSFTLIKSDEDEDGIGVAHLRVRPYCDDGIGHPVGTA